MLVIISFQFLNAHVFLHHINFFLNYQISLLNYVQSLCPYFEQQNYIKITQNLGMSNNNQQPSTTAKVILYTSHGQLDLQLWTKEAPLASRNFIQLCLQGYYTNTIFHRIIPGFMVQGGDPTGTGTGGQSVWGKPFKDQFHQRLKFSRRGLLAMANSGKNTNRSQFFITFGQCQHLNKKHTIFGKVIGDTIYNLLQMQSIDTDPATDRPIDPPVIRKVKVAVNPFDDIQPRVTVKQQKQNKLTKQQESRVIDNQKQAKKKQMKKLKQRNKLTFDDQELQPLQNDKMISAHDVLQDQKLCKKQAITYEQINKRRLQKQSQQNKKQALKSKIMQSQQVNHQHNQNEGFLQQQKQRKRRMLSNIQVNSNAQDEVLHYKKRVNAQTGKVQIYWVKQEQIEQQQNQQSPEIEDQKLREVRQLQIKEYQALKAEQLNFKRTKQGSLKQKRKQMIGEEKALLSNVQRRRYQYLKKTETEKREGQIFEKLGKFTNTLLHGGSWMNHGLKFHIDSENAYKISSQRNNNRQLEDDDGGLQMADDYVNIGKRDGIDIDELYELTKKDK